MHRVPLISNEQAQGDAREIFDNLEKKTGSVINMFRVLGHKPEVLKTLIPFYSAVTGKGSVDPKIKEYVYLKTSMVNRCEY